MADHGPGVFDAVFDTEWQALLLTGQVDHPLGNVDSDHLGTGVAQHSGDMPFTTGRRGRNWPPARCRWRSRSRPCPAGAEPRLRNGSSARWAGRSRRRRCRSTRRSRSGVIRGMSGCGCPGGSAWPRALNHLYVLLPVLDNAKHYWVSTERAANELLRTSLVRPIKGFRNKKSKPLNINFPCRPMQSLLSISVFYTRRDNRVRVVSQHLSVWEPIWSCNVLCLTLKCLLSFLECFLASAFSVRLCEAGGCRGDCRAAPGRRPARRTPAPGRGAHRHQNCPHRS